MTRQLFNTHYLHPTNWSRDPFVAFGVQPSPAMNFLLAHLVSSAQTFLEHDHLIDVTISLDNEEYKGDLWRTGVNPRTLRPVLKTLEDLGLAVVVKGSVRSGTRTTVTPTSDFIERTAALGASPTFERLGGRPLVYSKEKTSRSGVRVHEVKREKHRPLLEEHNERIWEHDIAYTPDANRSPVQYYNHLLLNGVSVNALFSTQRCYVAGQDDRNRLQLKAKGGRLVCAGHYLLTKSERSSITIDGSPVREIDIMSCQPRILFALANLDCPDDLYAQLLPSDPGKAKTVMTYAIGSNTPRWYNFNRIDDVQADPSTAVTRQEWDTIMDNLPESVRDILLSTEDLWGRTQYMESDWLLAVMEEFYQHHPDEVLLSWHDSILCKDYLADTLDAIMADMWQEVIGNNYGSRIDNQAPAPVLEALDTLNSDGWEEKPHPVDVFMDQINRALRAEEGSGSPLEGFAPSPLDTNPSEPSDVRQVASTALQEHVEKVEGALKDVFGDLGSSTTLAGYFNKPITSIEDDDNLLLLLRPADPKDIT